MLAGRPAFDGRSVVAILHATLYEQPPALTGSPAVAAVDRVIRRALAKKPGRAAGLRRGDGRRAPRRARHRRRRHAGDGARADAPRRAAVPRAAPRSRDRLSRVQPAGRDRDVARRHRLAGRAIERDRGALRRRDARLQGAGRRSRTSIASSWARCCAPATSCAPWRSSSRRPAGRVLTSHTVQSPLGDLFQLQDDIARRVVEALALPLGGGLMSPAPDAPRNPRAYELYLRAQRAGAHATRRWCRRAICTSAPRARPRLRAGVGAAGPLPSRDRQVHRPDARTATPRRGGLPPRAGSRTRGCRSRTSSMRNLEADTGHARTGDGAAARAKRRHGNDPELFAGLVHACRYCGLFEESIAAHAEARRLDPNVATSFEQTLLLTRDIERLVAADAPALSRRRRRASASSGWAWRADATRRDRRWPDEASNHGFRRFKRWTGSCRVARSAAADVVDHHAGWRLENLRRSRSDLSGGLVFCDAGDHRRGLEYLSAASPGATSPRRR